MAVTIKQYLDCSGVIDAVVRRAIRSAMLGGLRRVAEKRRKKARLITVGISNNNVSESEKIANNSKSMIPKVALMAMALFIGRVIFSNFWCCDLDDTDLR